MICRLGLDGLITEGVSEALARRHLAQYHKNVDLAFKKMGAGERVFASFLPASLEYREQPPALY